MGLKNINKLVLLLALIFCLPIVYGNNVSLFKPVLAEEKGAGQLSIYLFYYTYGGSYNRYKENSENKFVYNSELEQYTLDIVLFEGDFFAPNITGQGYISYSDKLSDETKQMFLSQNITNHTGSGGYQFHVNKSGTYRISISDSIDSYSKTEDFYKIWDDDNSNILYLSESIDGSNPLGNNNIYLVGNFDGFGWDGSRYTDRLFSYNTETKQYEFFYNLYAGDIFCPISPDHGYIKYYDSEYTNEKFKENNIEKSDEGYFVCKKDGFYKISIDYKVEYLFDSSFSWSEDIGSSITYLEKPVKPIVRGNETMILTGNINGSDVMINYNGPTYKFYYDPISMQYKIKVYLHNGDHLRPYLKNKGKNVYCKANSLFLKNMCDGINVEFVTISNIPSFKINNPGYYEIAIGANVENLQDESRCWLAHGSSYIRYLGLNVNTIFFSSNNNLGDMSKVFASGKGSVKQYGFDGININPVNFISLDSPDAHGYFYKIDYDSAYTDSITFTSGDVDNISSITIAPKQLACYDFESESVDESLGEACNFLSFLSSCMQGIKAESSFVGDYGNITPDQALVIKNDYSKLSLEAREHVNKANISVLSSEGKELSVHYVDIEYFIDSLIRNETNLEKKKTALYIIVGITLSITIGFVAISSKRKRSNRIIDNKDKKYEESRNINIEI